MNGEIKECKRRKKKLRWIIEQTRKEKKMEGKCYKQRKEIYIKKWKRKWERSERGSERGIEKEMK